MVLRLCLIFALLVLGCSNPYERDNPTDPAIVYKVTFSAGDATIGTPPAALTGIYGTQIQLPDGSTLQKTDSLKKTDSIFSMWKVKDAKDDRDYYRVNSEYIITGNITMDVIWSPLYTITFNGGIGATGTPPAAIKVASGSSPTLPNAGNLQKENHSFAGWTDSSGKATYYVGPDTDKPRVESNITLYAKWVRIFTVTFSGGTGATGTPPAAVKADSGSVIQPPEQGTLQKAGYRFGGWDVPRTVTDNITIYAKWIPIYTVTFNGNGSTSGTPPAAMKADSGSAIQIPDANTLTLQKTGYRFDGWNVRSPYTVTGDTTLYAKWIPIYTVTFSGNGATSGTPPAAVSIDSGSTVTVIQLPVKGNLIKTDHLFMGWNTSSSGAGDSYEVGSRYTVSKNDTLYALWISNYFTDTRDQKKYKITIIGTQVWFAENLRYEGENKDLGVCDEDTPAKCEIYGRKYNWATAMNLPLTCNSTTCANQVQSPHRGICPVGWRIPSEADWDKLFRFADGTSGTSSPYTSNTAGLYLKAKSGWPNDGNGTDLFEFSALPIGSASNLGYWTSATEANANNVRIRTMNASDGSAKWTSGTKTYTLSIRCMQDY